MSWLGKKIREQEFDPHIIGIFTNPVYFARKGLLHGLKRVSGKITGRILDVGSGTMPYRHLFQSTEYIGLELDSPENRQYKRANFFYNGKDFPFEDNSFDSVISSQVLEHVFNPDEFIQEIYRVLKPGGRCLITVPFVWEEHEKPYDFARYSSFGLRDLFTKHGFEVVEHIKMGGDATLIAQLLASQVRKIAPRQRLLKLLTYIVLIGPINIIGLVLSKILPKNPDLYLDNIIVVQKTKYA